MTALGAFFVAWPACLPARPALALAAGSRATRSSDKIRYLLHNLQYYFYYFYDFTCTPVGGRS